MRTMGSNTNQEHPETQADDSKAENAGCIGFFADNLRQLKRYMLTGLMVWIPLIISIWISWWVIYNIGFGIEDFIKRGLNVVADSDIFSHIVILGILRDNYRPGMGFLSAILLFICTGFVSRYLVARKVISAGEQIVARIPFMSRIYVAAQQIRDVFMNREGAVFQKVVILEYPRRGIFAVGFVTSTDQGIVQDTIGRDLTAVFLPTTPNPTSGFLLYLPSDELVTLHVTVEDAMKLIVSGGAYIPNRYVSFEEELARKGPAAAVSLSADPAPKRDAPPKSGDKRKPDTSGQDRP